MDFSGHPSHERGGVRVALNPAAWSAGSMRVGLYGLFFLSGFCALIYQTAWQRMLGLFTGSDAVAATLVVASFLFGLGVGSLWGGAIADRLSDKAALRGFGLCELGIGCFALASQSLFYDVLFGRLGELAAAPAPMAATVLLALLVPTTLMGLSLPLLSKVVVREIEKAGAQIGWLYGVNTVGAGAGCLLGGCVALGSLGFGVTVEMTAAISILIGIGALATAMTLPHEAVPVVRYPQARPAVTGGERPWSHGIAAPLVRWSAMTFASGFLIISLEILWFRVVGAMMQSDAYAFSEILAAFLLADAAGILAGARLVRGVQHPWRFFLALQAGAALYAVGLMGVLYLLHAGTGIDTWYIDAPLSAVTLPEKLGRLLHYALLIGFAVLPPAFIVGMSFPIIQKGVQDDPQLVGRRVGLVQLANILGNTTGALVTGLVLLEVIGTAGTLRLIAASGLLFALGLMGAGDYRRPGVVLVAALAVVVTLFPSNHRFWSRLHGGDPAVTDVGEDRTSVVALRPWQDHDMAAWVGGRWQNSMLPAKPVSTALGIVGLLIHPAPATALLVGHGGGASLLAMNIDPGPHLVRVVEIAKPVLSVVEHWAGRSQWQKLRELFTDPRVERIVADGRHLLFTEERRYDLVVAVAISPHTAHSGMLFSREFFTQVRDRLTDRGLFVQWAATPRTVATFLQVFPYVTKAGGALIGGKQPFDYSPEHIRVALEGAYHDRLAAIGSKPDEIIAWLEAEPLRQWGPDDARPDSDINTDLFPKDEYHLNHGASASRQ